jgi:hypothetical protein
MVNRNPHGDPLPLPTVGAATAVVLVGMDGFETSWHALSWACGEARREQLGQVIGQHPVVQHLVAVVQLFQIHVLGQVTALGLQLLIDPPRLLLESQHPDGSRPVNPRASRSAALNATPRFRIGSSSTPGTAGARVLAVFSFI